LPRDPMRQTAGPGLLAAAVESLRVPPWPGRRWLTTQWTSVFSVSSVVESFF
jgi:hypothetical protein